LELTETLFDFSRTWEHLQLDELPITLLVLAAALAWFASRRYREVCEEIESREVAEAKLAALLEQHKRLAQQHVQFQESERKALARELHDELGQYLHAIKTDAVAIQTKGAADAPTLKRAAAAIVAHCDHLQEVLRSLIGQLRPVGLDVLGLRAALEYLLERAQTRTPERKLAMQIEGDLDGLDEATSLTIYRLIQEGLTNVSRHSGAQRVVVQVVHDTAENMLLLRFSDDGRGADPTAKPAGLGIMGMRERVEMLGGELRVVTAPGAGFSIAARIPYRHRDAVPNLDVPKGALAYE
jgi:signal transduction histidine kinase